MSTMRVMETQAAIRHKAVMPQHTYTTLNTYIHMHNTYTHTTYAAAGHTVVNMVSYISTVTDIRGSLTTKILWVGKVRTVVKRDEARSTQTLA
jgi:hypothetical protein